MINDKNEYDISFIEENFLIKSYKEKKIKERIGMIIILLANLIFAFETIILKYSEEEYKDNFHYFFILILRSIGIFITIMLYNIRNIKSFCNNFNKEIKKHLFFIILKTVLYIFSDLFTVISLYYIRPSTYQIIAMLNPFLVQILSIIILKEKYKHRFLLGFILCSTGSYLIIYSENELSLKKDFTKRTGTISCLIRVLLLSINDILDKYLENVNIDINYQFLFISISTIIFGIGFVLVNNLIIIINIKCFLLNISQGFFFFVANVLLYLGLLKIDLIKGVLLSYSKVVFMFVFSYIFIAQRFSIYDALGLLIIMSYIIYDLKFPINKNKNKLFHYLLANK